MIPETEPSVDHPLQPSLGNMHRKNLDWLSAILPWKREVVFFQKLIENDLQKHQSRGDNRLDFLQSRVKYYSNELIAELRKKLNESENNLSKLVEEKSESDVQYFKEHQILMVELNSCYERYTEFKQELFDFIEEAM